MEDEIKIHPEAEEPCEHMEEHHIDDEKMQDAAGGYLPNFCPKCRSRNIEYIFYVLRCHDCGFTHSFSF